MNKPTIKSLTLAELYAKLNGKLKDESYNERRRAFNGERVHRHPASLKAHRRSKLKRRN